MAEETRYRRLLGQMRKPMSAERRQALTGVPAEKDDEAVRWQDKYDQTEDEESKKRIKQMAHLRGIVLED